MFSIKPDSRWDSARPAKPSRPSQIQEPVKDVYDLQPGYRRNQRAALFTSDRKASRSKTIFVTCFTFACVAVFVLWIDQYHPDYWQQLKPKQLASGPEEIVTSPRPQHVQRAARHTRASSENAAAPAAPSHFFEFGDDSKALLRNRKFAMRKLEFAQKFINAPSFAARAEAFCRSRVGQPHSLMMAFSGDIAGEDLDGVYAKLLAEEPQTREEELDRQRRLEVIRDLLSNYENNLRICQVAVTNGDAKMPPNSEEFQTLTDARAEIKDIDEQLSARK
jgi:hypothetical protein